MLPFERPFAFSLFVNLSATGFHPIFPPTRRAMLARWATVTDQ
jgi:hypothetical protein